MSHKVKDSLTEIRAINEALKNIRDIVEKLPAEASWAKSIKTSLENFDKKINNFLAENIELTEEQKKAIEAIKSGAIPQEALSSLVKGIGEQEVKEPSSSTKKSKKN